MFTVVREHARHRLRVADDTGVTIVELLVAMGIFLLVLVVFLAATVTMSRQAVSTQAIGDSASQLRTVYQRLDKEVRYASALNVPGTSSGNIYVEYLVPASVGTGEAQCVQWRYMTAEGELQRRTWKPDDASTVSEWSTMVVNLRNDLPSEQPFVFHRAGPDGAKVFVRQRLDVYLDAGLGEAGDAEGSQLDVHMVANNSSTLSETNLDETHQVCLVGGVQRP